MKQQRSLKKILVNGLLCAGLSVPTTGMARTAEESPSALAMVGDILIARPLLITATAVGTVLYGVSLPFSLLGGNAREAAEVLVLGPAKSAFKRCLGCNSTSYEEAHVTGEYPESTLMQNQQQYHSR